MKKLLAILVAMLVLPFAFAASVGTGIGVDITTEDFAPLVWLCDNRVVADDNTEPGRTPGSELVERINNYAFEGESITWTVLVMDKNKIDQNIDVYATIGSTQGTGNDIEVNCWRAATQPTSIPAACNAEILEEELSWNPELMAMFDCTLTVETADSMYGEYWITVEAMDGDGMSGAMAENEYWFLNPTIALSIDGDLTFSDVRPGTSAYSQTMLVGNDADDGSGVMLDMFISGTDFYDSSSSGARCPSTNQLSLSAFRYYAVNGAYSTADDGRSDAEGYVPIEYGIGFNNPNAFYENNEIMQVQSVAGYYLANIVAPGAEMAITFRLELPEPCNGDFDSGAIYFWGEAI